jgi:predicted Zn-dependent protease
MKRYLPLALILAAGLAAIGFVEWRKIDTRPSPEALLSLTSDAQREASHFPNSIDRMSDEDEIRLGNELASTYAPLWPKKPADEDRTIRVEAYLTQVGVTVAAHATRKLPYHFHYIADPGYINAFALPGGHVFVGEGLLNLMKSEDALAAVLGHEIEHIDLRHCADRAQSEARLRNLGALGDLIGLPVSIFEAGYSRQQELEADRAGTALAVAAGYSPQGILDLFDAFAALEKKTENQPGQAANPADEAAGLTVQTLEDYFRSHPPSVERKEQVEKLVSSNHWAKPRLRPLGCRDWLEKSESH